VGVILRVIISLKGYAPFRISPRDGSNAVQ
jgi:hypothetical protein